MVKLPTIVPSEATGTEIKETGTIGTGTVTRIAAITNIATTNIRIPQATHDAIANTTVETKEMRQPRKA
jgi:hypothetical protein